jgi:hypothetical protein
MEDVLDVYCRPYDQREPVVCLDEMGKILVKEKHPAEPAKVGQDRREDYTYEKKDWASFIEELLTVHYPHARKLILVLDNLNTHTPISLYDTFPPDKAKGLLDRLEIHSTPKHACLSQYRRD